MTKLLATLSVLLLCACGGSRPAAQPPPPDKTEGTSPADEAAMGGENVDRLCNWYVDSKHEGEWDGEGEKPAPDPTEVAACKDMMNKRSPLERQHIAECANSCGAADGVVSCFDDYGTPAFDINCGNAAAADDDDDE